MPDATSDWPGAGHNGFSATIGMTAELIDLTGSTDESKVDAE